MTHYADYTNRNSRADNADTDAARWTFFIFLPAVWLLPCLLFTVIIAFLTGLALIPPGWAISPLVALFVAYSLDRALHQRREWRARTVLSYLHHAVRLNLPLDPYLAAAIQSERGRTRRYLAGVREMLQSGYSLHDALAQSVPDLPRGAAATLAAAEPIGQFAPTLQRLIAADRVQPIVDDSQRAPYQRFYPISLLLMFIGVLTYFCIWIMPKFREIFKDFKMPLPPITENVLAISNFIGESIPIIILLVGALLFSIFAPMSFYLHRIFLPFWRLPPLGRVTDVLRWWTPILRSVERDRGMAATTEFLAQATAAGVPLTAAVERTLQLPTNPYFRAHLRRWADLLHAGHAPDAAARMAGLPDLLAGLLAPNSDALPAMFAFLARYYRGRFSRTLILLRAATEPFIVLFFGTLVFFFAAAAIIPIARLLTGVMGPYAPESL